MFTFLGVLSFFGMLIALICVIYPLRVLYMGSRRKALGVLAAFFAMFVTFSILAGPAEQKQSQGIQQQALAAPSNPTNEDGCNLAGAIPNCKEELLKMVAAQAALPKLPQQPSNGSSGNCKSNWRQCRSNSDLMNNFGDITRGEVSCKFAAEKLAKYGSASFPFFSFTDFLKGDDYVRTGIATLIEDDAQFQNGFGAMVHSSVTCLYDLNSQRVVDVSVSPH
jgi:hypothetical protein